MDRRRGAHRRNSVAEETWGRSFLAEETSAQLPRGGAQPSRPRSTSTAAYPRRRSAELRRSWTGAAAQAEAFIASNAKSSTSRKHSPARVRALDDLPGVGNTSGTSTAPRRCRHSEELGRSWTGPAARTSLAFSLKSSPYGNHSPARGRFPYDPSRAETARDGSCRGGRVDPRADAPAAPRGANRGDSMDRIQKNVHDNNSQCACEIDETPITTNGGDCTDQIQNENNFQNIKNYSRSRRRQDDDMVTVSTEDQALRPSAILTAKEKNIPHGDVTIVFTDVQGSTSFWETCPGEMKKATDIYDNILRRCYADHHGYEISSTAGNSFRLAFQYPVDALGFALQAQLKLYKADWPEEILKHPDGKDEPVLKFRGFRVRFGIHHGPTESRVHEMTGRNMYSGEGVDIAKAVKGLCHGGQILTTMQTWKAVSGMSERYIGRPQVIDCGEHLLFESKIPNSGSSGYTMTRYTRRIMQLVPGNLAFDFFEARGRREVLTADGKIRFEVKDASDVTGRLFPPLTSKRQLSTCFLNAPHANGRVTICFVYTVGLDNAPDHRTENLGTLAKFVRKKLLVSNPPDPPGYVCREYDGCWMLAFDRMASAVAFGLALKSTVTEVNDLAGAVDCKAMFKVGILSGAFTSMGPHKTTGMADYFGPIVNRSSQVASNCKPGQVCVGIPLSNGVTADPPDFGSTVKIQLQGIKKLKGMTIDMAIFTCTKRIIDTPYI